MRRELSIQRLVLLGSIGVLGGCSGSPRGQAGCSDNSDCDPGQVCQVGVCVTLCVTQGDCPGDQVCSNAGVCEARTTGAAPVINSVMGNAPNAPDRVLNGMIVAGTTLASAVFELREGANAIALATGAQGDTEVELFFPPNVVSGAYMLVATNQAGSDQESVTLTLPELDGDELLSRLNDNGQTTGTFVIDRLPVGTAAGNVATGNHVHDGAYLSTTGGRITGDLTVDGALGIGRRSPTTRLETAAGYTYANVNPSSAQNFSVRCDCDVDDIAADCGDPVTIIQIEQFTDSGPTCYDNWTIDANAGATQFDRYGGEPPLPGLAVTAEARVGIRTVDPTEALEVRGHALAEPITGEWGPSAHGSSFTVNEYNVMALDREIRNTNPVYFSSDGVDTITFHITGYYRVDMRTITYNAAGHGNHVELQKDGARLHLSHAMNIAALGWRRHATSVVSHFDAGSTLQVRVHCRDTTSTHCYHSNDGDYTALTVTRMN